MNEDLIFHLFLLYWTLKQQGFITSQLTKFPNKYEKHRLDLISFIEEWMR